VIELCSVCLIDGVSCQNAFAFYLDSTSLGIGAQWLIYGMAGIRAGPSMCGVQCKTKARGLTEQWCYYIIVLSQPCYGLFDEDILAK